ncbi:hypothetical protein [Streptomyces sp. NPDC000229]|uniref:hypothetical protein n=1 Tax=Streptomyces sp. NPDC000229 TaxID=3154247 RepID=UPI003327E789
MKQLKRPARPALLVVHGAVSVSWLGLTLGVLALGIAAYTTAGTSLTEAAYRAMKVFGDWLLAPAALVSLVSGLILALGTPWGLARHRWVTMTAISVLKPWGLTRRGRRLRAVKQAPPAGRWSGPGGRV